jgi:hypothetical protein
VRGPCNVKNAINGETARRWYTRRDPPPNSGRSGEGWWFIQNQAMHEVERFKTQYSVNEVDSEEDAFTGIQWVVIPYRQSCMDRFGGPSLRSKASRPAPPCYGYPSANVYRPDPLQPAFLIDTQHTHTLTYSLSFPLVEACPKHREDISRSPPTSFPPAARAHEMAGRWMGREREGQKERTRTRVHICVDTHLYAYVYVCVCVCVCV